MTRALVRPLSASASSPGSSIPWRRTCRPDASATGRFSISALGIPVALIVVIGSSQWVAERVARREVSLGMAGEVEWPDGVIAEPFLEDEVIGIAPPDRLGSRVSAEDLAAQTLLVREPGSSTRAVAERYLARVGYRPAKRWELDSNEAIKRTVRAGLGIGFVSRLVVEEEIARGELEPFTVEGAGSMQRSVYLLRPDGRDPVPAERAFIETLCSCCAASVAGCTA
jgi:LysR family transcriptional regulator, low CO2-responsive transcriptional regulator